MLRVEGLDVQYGRIRAVRDVSLEVSQGEIVGLLGPNGAGKTSTLGAVSGRLPVAGGRVLLEGEQLDGRPAEEIVRRGVSLVPEGRHVFATLTVAENLAIGATVRKDRAQVAEDIERQLERFSVLRRYYRSNAGKLSGGEQQQLVIARALLSRPRLLLLDEPSLGLSPLLVDLVFETIEQLRAEGLTILLVEQNASRTVEVADRCYVLRGGELVAHAPRGDLSPEELGDIYLGAGER
ncbi:ABC transporter ATP-binding protein [Geodermatophilus ruber]|uniref:Amino acid/amide ABC transporter ATP-binding protein 2, HAAT family n=1 Tax=Geodermatophilus ruber TaxID=504800 RepID=A0A1I4K2D6_9ACTN|nr:ABC transporter ATP-binding protein [Geodermatophilus ruber]SFL72932.1 amino acid/amide ABC transporter ATP-binding protein 2, HAAT family [Geodermatophilus ruber]